MFARQTGLLVHAAALVFAIIVFIGVSAAALPPSGIVA